MQKTNYILNTKNCIMLMDNLVDKETCDIVIDMGAGFLNTNNLIHKTGYTVENSSVRQDTQLYIPFGVSPNIPFDLYRWVQEMVMFSASIYAKTIHDLYVSSPIVKAFKWQKTEPHQKGFSGWHTEQGPEDAGNRSLVWMLYLNDVEKGGETEFLYQGISVKPEAGRFVLWPAGVTHPHRGNPPYSNTKYILTGWLEMPNNYEFLISRGIYERMMNENYNDIQLFKLPETVIKKMEKE